MASQETQEHSDRMKQRMVPVGTYLQTPPDYPADSFTQEHDHTAEAVKDWRDKLPTTLPPIQAHTPPASPESKVLPSISTAAGYAAHDAPLFSDDRTHRARSQTPLFESELHSTQPRAQTATPTFRSINAAPIEPDPYPTILNITSPEDALQYWQDRKDELMRLRDLPRPQAFSMSVLDRESRRQLSSISRPAGITKAPRTPKMPTKMKAAVSASPEKATLPPRRRTPKAKTIPDFVDSAFPQKESTKHKRAAPSKKVDGDNLHWSEIPDYAPPTSTLDSNPKPLKAGWHGNPLDLSNDPDRAHCHPQELNVAGVLRLTCAQYLTNKRKIFQGRVQALKDGKNFTKTAAQGVCAIDVNKASQLWEAFERVGWFKESLFEQYL